MIQLHVATGCAPTARILEGLLTAQGMRVGTPADADVCWGLGRQARNVLNANCSAFYKMEQLNTLRCSDIVTPAVYATVPPPEAYPIMGRMLQHVGGRDIIVCLQPEDAQVALRNHTAEYFTKFVPSTEEFRVWIYRRQHLGTYRKTLTRPRERRGYGRNYDNGYSFQLVPGENVSRAAVDIAARAVTALGLDFGAVDMLRTTNQYAPFTVLEVNTAPGVEGPDRQVIQGLARKIFTWERMGYPKRKGT